MDFILNILVIILITLVAIGILLLGSAPICAEKKSFQGEIGGRINIMSNFRFLNADNYKNDKRWVSKAIKKVWIAIALGFLIVTFSASILK